jgi:P27 family predicted phage terminase small subunit
MAGPARTPTETRRAKGNPGKRPYNKREPKLPTAAPAEPHGLKGEALAEWRRLVGEALQARVLTRIDRGVVDLAAQAYATWKLAEETVAKVGQYYESTNTEGGTVIKAHPCVAIASDAWRRYRAAICELGFTPAARSKVSTTDPGEEIAPGAAYFN